MPYRLATGAIVAFWLVMTGLLIRLEVRPEQSTVLEIPVSYVMRIMFKNGVQSIMALRNDDKTLGTLSLRPHIDAAGRRLLDFSGGVSLPWPPGELARVNFSGAFEMDKMLQVRDFDLDGGLQQPRYRLKVHADTGAKTLHYELFGEDQLLGQELMPLEMSAIVPAVLQALGMNDGNAAALPLVQNNLTAPVFSARETQIELRGEKLDVFEITALEGGAAVGEIYVSQVGQVLMVKTNFGYTLATQDFQ